jgi:hypothetical protein
MKQTAVEWYSNKLLEILGESVNNFTTEQTMANHYALEQAEEMFKKQIENCFMHGQYSVTIANGEQYYNETFKHQK